MRKYSTSNTAPSQLKYARVECFESPQVKTMLEFLGLPIRLQPHPRKDRDVLLRERIVMDPLKAQTAYEVIVLGKLPEVAQAAQADIDSMRSHYLKAVSDALSDSRVEAMNESIRETVYKEAGKIAEQLSARVKQAISEAAEKHRPIVIKTGTSSRVIKGVLPKEFPEIVQLASQRVPIMLVGPAGCGKTYIAGKLAEATEGTVGPRKGKSLEFYDQSCSEGVSESIFTGWLLPVEKGGTFDYVSSPFIQAYEKGGVFLLDEMDAADPNLLTFLNKAIANESFYLPQRYKNPLVKKHPDFVVVAAANTFGQGADAQYVGRNALDAATLDRFRAGMIHMDYSAEVEEALVDAEVLQWGLLVRQFIYASKLRRIMSTRVLLDLTKMKGNCGWTKTQWERSYFADWSRDELDRWRRIEQTRAVNPGQSGVAA